MAEFLVRAIDNVMQGSSNSRDQSGSYKWGDITQFDIAAGNP